MEEIKDIEIPETQEETGAITMPSDKHRPDTNQVKIVGRVSAVYENEKKTQKTMIVQTFTGPVRQDASYLRVYLYDEQVRKDAEAFQRGDHVTVEGYLSSYRRDDGTFATAITGTNIQSSTSKMQDYFQVDGRIFESPHNEVYVTGEVFRNTQVSRNMVQLVIRSQFADGRYRYINCVLFARNRLETLFKEILVGNKVCMYGEVQTREVTPDGRPVIVNTAQARRGNNNAQASTQPPANNGDNSSETPKRGTLVQEIVVLDIRKI